MRALKREQAAYVSCGEWFVDPRVTKAEQQRRYLLAKLTHDVAMMSDYCATRDPKGDCSIYVVSKLLHVKTILPK